jgi:NTE family protein
MHHHLRPGHREDLSRLARLLAHRAVGLVLAGGGARGFAHIGVVKAMREAGIPIDLVGGSSMGAIVGAAVAMGWTHQEMMERFHASFVKTNPLSDWRLPTVSVYAGEKVGRLLQVAFGERFIEDMPSPFYAMVADIDAADAIPERKGLLWKHLLTSASIPGLLPPLIRRGAVLVDGGTLENFPVGPMAALDRGPLVGVDIDTTGGLGDDEVPAWQHWWARARGRREGPVLPRIVRILLRSAMAGSTARARLARDRVDLLFLPPVHDIDLLDWGAMERAMERGYRHASELLEQRRGTPEAAWFAAT